MGDKSTATGAVLVDGMNVIGSRPDGWWRDRDGAIRGLVDALAEWRRRTGADVTVVFDGRPLAELPEGRHAGVQVAYARRAGRDAADDRIAELAGPETVVVTSDRALADRARSAGARTRGASWLREQLVAGNPWSGHGMNEEAERSGEAPPRSEREVLLAYLNHLRGTMALLLDGLTEEQLRTPGVPSGTSLLGLVHHLTGVERHWFQRVFLGEEVATDLSMEVPARMTRDEVVTAYRQACDRSDAIVGDCLDLTQRSVIANPGEDTRDTLCSILVHMVEETARHAGHGDILREQIDGATGL